MQSGFRRGVHSTDTRVLTAPIPIAASRRSSFGRRSPSPYVMPVPGPGHAPHRGRLAARVTTAILVLDPLHRCSFFHLTRRRGERANRRWTTRAEVRKARARRAGACKYILAPPALTVMRTSTAAGLPTATVLVAGVRATWDMMRSARPVFIRSRCFSCLRRRKDLHAEASYRCRPIRTSGHRSPFVRAIVYLL